MAHPIYKNKEGKRLPSVTTVINKLKEADGMIYAAWKLGTEGKDYKAEWSSKADSGTLAHDLIHKYDVDLSKWDAKVVEKAQKAYENGLTYLTQSKLETECSEISLVCECHQVGGTIDDIFLFEGQRSIGDIKTGKIYYNHLIQLAAYKHLWEINFPEKPITAGFHVLHFDKENGDFGHIHFSNLDEAWDAFVHMRALYDLTNTLKERI